MKSSKGFDALSSNYIYLKLLTTPQMFFLVDYFNANGFQFEPNINIEKFIDSYYDSLANSCVELAFELSQSLKETKTIYVDCANGVGGFVMQRMQHIFRDLIDFRILNFGND